MRNTTHQIVGVTCAIAASRALQHGTLDTAAVSVASMCGSLLPDADRLGTRVHRRTRAERRSVVLGAIGFLLRLPVVTFALLARHRGFSHSLLACAVLIAGAAMIGPHLERPGSALIAGLALGYVAHVAADGCTPHGVGLWSPFAARRVRLLPRRARVPTGSLRERLVAVAATLVAVVLVIA